MVARLVAGLFRAWPSGARSKRDAAEIHEFKRDRCHSRCPLLGCHRHVPDEGETPGTQPVHHDGDH
jgi:hypothetical protein